MMLAGAACVPAGAGDEISDAETVIGRARWRGNVMLLTDAPALIAVDVERLRMTRQPLSQAGVQVSRLWGLAEDDGRLFTVSAFNKLVEINAAGAFVEAATLGRPVLNLVDLEAGMAVQLASQPAGSPLLVGVDMSGALAPISSPLRSALGLTPPEEGLLHLLSCSVPPQSICWLPGDPRIFASDARALVHRTRLAGLSPPDPAALIAAPERRVIEDALSDGDDVVALRNVAGGVEQRLTRYNSEGVETGEMVPQEPLRLLVAESSRGMLAVTRTGRLVIVEM